MDLYLFTWITLYWCYNLFHVTRTIIRQINWNLIWFQLLWEIITNWTIQTSLGLIKCEGQNLGVKLTKLETSNLFSRQRIAKELNFQKTLSEIPKVSQISNCLRWAIIRSGKKYMRQVKDPKNHLGTKSINYRLLMTLSPNMTYNEVKSFLKEDLKFIHSEKATKFEEIFFLKVS